MGGIVQRCLFPVVLVVRPGLRHLSDQQSQRLQPARLRRHVQRRVAVAIAEDGALVVHLRQDLHRLVGGPHVGKLHGVVHRIPPLRVPRSQDALDFIANLQQPRRDVPEHARLDGIDDDVPTSFVNDVQVRPSLDQLREEPAVVSIHRQQNGRATLAIVCVDTGVCVQEQVCQGLVSSGQRSVQRSSDLLIRRVHDATGSQQELRGLVVVVGGGLHEGRPPVRVRPSDVSLGIQEAAHRDGPPITRGVVERGALLPVDGVDLDLANLEQAVQHNEVDAVRKMRPNHVRGHVLQGAEARALGVLLTVLLVLLHDLLPDLLQLLPIPLGDEVHERQLRRRGGERHRGAAVVVPRVDVGRSLHKLVNATHLAMESCCMQWRPSVFVAQIQTSVASHEHSDDRRMTSLGGQEHGRAPILVLRVDVDLSASTDLLHLVLVAFGSALQKRGVSKCKFGPSHVPMVVAFVCCSWLRTFFIVFLGRQVISTPVRKEDRVRNLKVV
mmetsp:Transcript_153584/g.492262  ORF Transcript_153584/g.492262 Transcript_153584/m.492262 type:complete len:497 (+) Transcript_153584:1753-3243(+)